MESDPTHWTIRFKNGRITILLLLAPLTPLATLKTTLLDTLRERYPSGLPPTLATPKTQAIPEDADDLLLASPNNELELAEGWEAVGGDKKDCPRAMGWRDGGVVAFGFRDTVEANGWDVEIPTYEDSYPEAEDDL
jgi:hypothetical protein